MLTTEQQGLLTLQIVFSSVAQSRLCFVHYCSFTFHCKLFTCRARNRKLGGNADLAVNRLREDEQILVSEVISSVSYAPVQMEQMSLAWHIGAKCESNG